jgi:hypothetical protein
MKGQNMPDIVAELSSLAKERRALYARWRDEVIRLDDKRNQTAGSIYENTKKIDAAFDRILAAEYAETWVERWLEDKAR